MWMKFALSSRILLVSILALQSLPCESIALQHENHLEKGVEVRIKCDVSDKECSKHAEDLRSHITKDLMDSVKVVVDQATAFGSNIISSVHFDGAVEDFKYDLQFGWNSFKRSFENLLASKNKLSSKSLIKINSISDFSRFLSKIGSKQFFVISTDNEALAQKFNEQVRSEIDSTANVLHFSCDSSNEAKIVCKLLDFDSSKQNAEISLMTSNFASMIKKTIHNPNDSTFAKDVAEFLNQNMKTFSGSLRMYYAPWCGHCQRAKPAFLEAQEILKKELPGFLVEAIDCTTERETCQKLEIRGYPTFKLNEGEYGGSRSKEDFIRHAKNNAVPVISSSESPISQIMTPDQIAAHLKDTTHNNKLLILVLKKKMSPQESLKLIKLVADEGKKQSAEYAVAFAIAGVNPAFDSYLKINSNYDVNLVLLSDGALKSSFGELDETSIKEIMSNNDFGRFSAVKREPIVPFKRFPAFLPFSTNAAQKINNLVETVSKLGVKVEPMYDFNQILFLVNDEHVVKLEAQDFANIDYAINKFKEIMETNEHDL